MGGTLGLYGERTVANAQLIQHLLVVIKVAHEGLYDVVQLAWHVELDEGHLDLFAPCIHPLRLQIDEIEQYSVDQRLRKSKQSGKLINESLVESHISIRKFLSFLIRCVPSIYDCLVACVINCFFVSLGHDDLRALMHLE